MQKKFSGDSSADILVTKDDENILINLNHVVKITKLVDEEFIMRDVDF